jgi:phosphoribosylformylglycinamidine cyclo-ligase
MFRVFNMGHRMEVYTDQVTAASLIEAAEAVGIRAAIIGRCEPHATKQVTIESEHGTFVYNN